ncbi:NADP-dependent malic enzyme [Lentilactobacillus sp. SPB1-3]|uniref:NADP-dependent malic enzyme n=1 Tax=Lentilactobacillus terminaliae TaxID=3003483 RepID=A0ACD5DG84_9LACO|nr:NADP-dependent malic enzyme [Lentilactobacillus sp. SPB1-3]MCZ0976685.1 NADP-dependent malic enzyme [Lentilactobacillus sp. SPB1-3]
MTEAEDILKLHAAHTGVLDIKSDLSVNTKADLSKAYTPGVAILSKKIAADPELKNKYTISGKLVALVTDGSAVLGLGNIGPAGGLPVIEGKALLYKDLAGISAIPVAVDQVSVDEVVNTIKNISLSFAGIHLEDIAAPRCFEIEDKLKQVLDIPVYHDDQEGTAIVVLAGLINACRLTSRDLKYTKIVINGVGASGLATARLLFNLGFKNLTLVDVYGVVTPEDDRYNHYQRDLARQLGTPADLKNKKLSDVIKNQDVFIGLSDQNVMSASDVEAMNDDPIIFALANPVPEIDPDIASKAGAKVIATGSSQYPNQVNNILAFPGLFKGLLANGIKKVDFDLQFVIAKALANTVEKVSAEEIVPSVFDERVVKNVSQAVTDFSKTK